jgi:2-oxoglutarate/2-oxoacid ferredoxin oxidoreductase subunit alpha
MNSGMMLDDVVQAVQGKTNIEFYGRMGGLIPFPEEILDEIERINKGTNPLTEHPRDAWLNRMDSIIAR